MGTLKLVDAQRKIFTIWLTGSLILFIIIFLQVMLGKYGIEYLKVSGWYTQNILPTLGLQTASLIYVSKNENSFSQKNVPKFYLSLAKKSSYGYFIILFLTIFLQQKIYSTTNINALEVLSNSTLFISIFQTIITSILGLLFFKAE